MGAISDVTSEFKGAGPREKIVIVVGVLGVAGVAYYLYTKKQQTASQQGVLPSQQQSLGQRTGFPETSTGIPNVPSGVTPIFDPSGSLVGWSSPPIGGGNPPQGGTPNPTPIGGGNPPQGGTPTNWYTNILKSLAPGTKITPGGYDVNGQRFWVGSGNSQLFYAPIGSTINYGGAGRVWITPKGGTQQLLTK